MIELSQDDLDALARCFRLLAARGRQLRRIQEVKQQPAADEAAIGPESVKMPRAGRDTGNEERQ